ncbi:hypothetical protein GCM10009099_37850 [Caenispirillum bisanense]
MVQESGRRSDDLHLHVRKARKRGLSLKGQPPPMLVKQAVDPRRFSADELQGLPVVLHAEGECLFGFGLGVRYVNRDGGAVIVRSATAVEAGVTEHLLHAPTVTVGWSSEQIFR